MNTLVQQGQIKIGRDTFAVGSLKEAVSCWIAARETYGWGASDSPAVNVTFAGCKYRISYNGRLWDREGNEVLA
jgi:hypothetical protein